jgi:hypothetical protein
VTQFFALTDVGLATDVGSLMQNWLNYMQSTYPGYQPSAGNLEYVQALIFCTLAADVATQASSGATELFSQFGQQLLGIPVEGGASAVAVVQVSAVDSQGYTLPSAAQFLLDSNTGFQSYQTTIIPAGSTTAIVPIAATTPGTAGNGLGSVSAILNQTYDWVSAVSIVTPSSGGVDAEDPDAYVTRLTNEIKLMAPRPITASDYGTFALSFQPTAGTDQQEVGRATALDGYDPNYLTDGGTQFGNERTITICVTDSSGNALNADTMAAVQAWVQTYREVNFIVNVIPPTYVPIYVKVSVARNPTYTAAAVQANIQGSLVGLLSPANWGFPTDSSTMGGWVNEPTLYQSVIESTIQQSAGVDHIVNNTLGFGLTAGSTNTGDLALTGGIILPTTSSGATVPLSAITVVN